MAILRLPNPHMTMVPVTPAAQQRSIKTVSRKPKTLDGDIAAPTWWSNLTVLRASLIAVLVITFNVNLYLFSVFGTYEDSLKTDQLAIEMELRGNELEALVGHSESQLRKQVRALEEKLDGIKANSQTRTAQIFLYPSKMLKGSKLKVTTPIAHPKGGKKEKGSKKEKGAKKEKGSKKEKGAKKEKKHKGSKEPKKDGPKKEDKEKKHGPAKDPKDPKKSGPKKGGPKENLYRNADYHQAVFY